MPSLSIPSFFLGFIAFIRSAHPSYYVDSPLALDHAKTRRLQTAQRSNEVLREQGLEMTFGSKRPNGKTQVSVGCANACLAPIFFFFSKKGFRYRLSMRPIAIRRILPLHELLHWHRPSILPSVFRKMCKNMMGKAFLRPPNLSGYPHL